jgi:hypothetical protein
VKELGRVAKIMAEKNGWTASVMDLQRADFDRLARISAGSDLSHGPFQGRKSKH